MSLTLFDEARPVPDHRVDYLAGMLSEWAFGETKPTKAQKARLREIANDALVRARELAT